jgi:hypothetical protein
VNGKLEFSSQQRLPEAGARSTLQAALISTSPVTKTPNVTGTLSGTQSQRLTRPTCPSDTNTPGRISAKLNGIAKEDTISLDVSGGSYTPPDMTPCPFGRQPSKAPAVYTRPHFSQIFHELKKRPDGSYHVDREWTNSGGTHPYTEHYALKLEPL